jgi:membrane protease YdiL (CAAX protease family)
MIFRRVSQYCENRMEKPKFVNFLIIVLFALYLLVTMSSFWTKSLSWFYPYHSVICYLIFVLFCIGQIKDKFDSNIDFFTICLILVLQLAYGYPNHLVNGLLLLISLFLIIYLYENRIEVPKLNIHSIITFIIGILFGIIVAGLKLSIKNPALLTSAYVRPWQFVQSLATSIVFNSIWEEFVFRGVFWGYLKKKHFPDLLVIFITSVFWVSIHLSPVSAAPELLNVFFFGIISGLLVKLTRKINISIGMHAGYNSFLIFQRLFP